MTSYGPDDVEDWTLWYPDGSTEALGTGVVSVVFCPTGQLVAWAQGDHLAPTHTVTIRDLRTGVSRIVDTEEVATFGFVRIPDSDLGVVAWVCDGQALELVGLEPEDSHVLAENVICETVRGGELSTRLLYVDLDEVLSVIDARDGNQWSTVPVDGWPKLSPDGRLALDFSSVVDLDRNELVATCEFARFHQAIASSAPLFVSCEDELSVWRNNALEHIHDEVVLTGAFPGLDGSVVFRRLIDDQEELWYAPADDLEHAQLIISYPSEPYHSYFRTSDHQHGRIVLETDACAEVDCATTITEIWPWTPAGLGPPMLAAGYFQGLHVFDDGQALGAGSVIEGPLPEGVPIPEALLVLSDPDGALVNTWQLDGDASHSLSLGDGRLLLYTLTGLRTSIFVFDREAPEYELLLEQADVGRDLLDPRLGLLSLEAAIGGIEHLYWGAVPD